MEELGETRAETAARPGCGINPEQQQMIRFEKGTKTASQL